MKIIEQYYGAVRCDPYSRGFPDQAFNSMCDREVYLEVEVNGRKLRVKNYIHDRLPASIAMKEARHQIMAEVEREVFGS